MIHHVSEYDPASPHNPPFQDECREFAEKRGIKIEDMLLDDVEDISRKHGPGLGFYLTGTGPRDRLAGQVEDLLNAAGRKMEYPEPLALKMMHDCTFAYKKGFPGFGKNRPLVLRNWGSQTKRRGEKIGFKIFFDGCGLKVKHLWTIMDTMALDIQMDMRRHPMPEEIKTRRATEIGFSTRNSDDYIVNM